MHFFMLQECLKVFLDHFHSRNIFVTFTAYVVINFFYNESLDELQKIKKEIGLYYLFRSFTFGKFRNETTEYEKIPI